MDSLELKATLERLIATWENEVVEFKQAGNDYDTDKIGEYFSALSNEANLRGTERGWLVFGVNDKTRTVVGTNYRLEPERLHGLKNQNGRVVVTEQPDRLIFENEGGFFDGQPDEYVEGTKIPRRYRNPFLAQAMAELNMIDTMRGPRCRAEREKNRQPADQVATRWTDYQHG